MANFRDGSAQKNARCVGEWWQILGDQIVDFVASDGDFSEFASGEGGGQNYFAVHVGGIGFGTG